MVLVAPEPLKPPPTETLGDIINIICYAKITDDKEEGVKLAGVYFGGAAKDTTGAATIIRDCINNVRGGTILAKSWQTTGPGQLLATMKIAHDHYRKIEQQMVHNQEIIARNGRK